MIEPIITITLTILNLLALAMALPISGSDFDCNVMPRSTFLERDFLNFRPTGAFVNMSKQKLLAPCFNASFPTSLTVEEGDDVVLPCVVHNVDFNNIVMSWWKERAMREIAVGDNISDKRFSIDKSIRGGWSLRIANVSLRDRGVYICQINSKQLRERFISLTVTAKRPPILDLSSNDVLVKDEAVHPVQINGHSTHGSVWKPFLPAVGYDWNQMQTPSASTIVRFSPFLLTTYIMHNLIISTT